MNEIPGTARGRTFPVTDVTWFDCVRFCNALSAKDGKAPAYRIQDGRFPRVHWDRRASGYRLLTEAEWERAARADQETRYAGGDEALEVGWFSENASRSVGPATTSLPGRRRRAASTRESSSPQPTARKAANAWGMYDFSGNVWEWVWDHGAPFPPGDQIDPTGPARGTTRVCRGGGWRSRAADVPLSARLGASPSEAADDRGFRIACQNPEP